MEIFDEYEKSTYAILSNFCKRTIFNFRNKKKTNFQKQVYLRILKNNISIPYINFFKYLIEKKFK